MVTDVGHRRQHGIESAKGTGKAVVNLAPTAEERELEKSRTPVEQVHDGGFGQQMAVADDGRRHFPLAEQVEDLEQVLSQKRLAAGEGDVMAAGLVEGFVQQGESLGSVQFALGIGGRLPLSIGKPGVVAMETGMVATLGDLKDEGLETGTGIVHSLSLTSRFTRI
jgi:hypothetical protein